jgi:hypothetical protein
VGIEHRNGRTYLYRSRRVGRHVRREYVASGFAATLADKWEQIERDRRDFAAWERATRIRRADEALAAGEEFDRLAALVYRAAMYLTGHTLHKRSEWRRTRGVQPMATIHDLGETPRTANADHGAPGAVDAGPRTVLDAAGRNEQPALAAARELMKNRKQVDALGYAALTARASLVSLAAAKDSNVAAALVAQCEQQTRELLAESGPEPSLAERMAAARVVNNWLTVHTLEALAATNAAASGPAGALDRRLTQAEKRLHASLKSLAVLRRLRKPVVVTQANIAKGGPMVVNNGTGEGEL